MIDKTILSEDAIQNLQILANYLLTIGKDKLYMSAFRAKQTNDSPVKYVTTPFISKDDCGTVGCAVGEGMLCDKLAPIKTEFTFTSFSPLGTVEMLNVTKYMERIYDMTLIDNNIAKEIVAIYLFSQYWESVDNTVMGVIQRIYRFLNDGIGEYTLNYLPNNVKIRRVYESLWYELLED